MKKNIAIILWSLSVLAALFIGQALNDPVSFTQTSEAEIYKPVVPKQDVAVSSLPEAEPVSDSVESSIKHNSFIPQPIKTPVSVDGVIQDLVNHFEKPDRNNFDNYRYMADTWEKLKGLDETQLLDVYEQLNAENEKGVNWNIARIIYARMGELNPGKAIEHAMENKQGHAITGVIKSWSEKNPVEAFEWIQNNKDSFPKSNNVNYYELFKNVAKTDLEKAMEGLKSFDLAKQRNAFNGILNTAETNEDFMKILGQVDNFKDSGNKVASALYYWSQKSPIDAVAWAGTIESEKDKKNAMKKIESAWLRKNPIEAADWIMSHKEDKNSAVSTIVNGWDWREGDKLYTWVQNQGEGEARDNANYNLIRRYSYNNVDLAKKAVDKIVSEEVRKKAVTQLYRSLRYRNQKAAEDFLNGRDEIPDAEKEKLLSMQTGR
ncbi:MAG: hypothetical protein NE328_10390 [Lentisphaeraceae bacterium]|nr:hypothetical protein [Lentisphaeraceae bacterium]